MKNRKFLVLISILTALSLFYLSFSTTLAAPKKNFNPTPTPTATATPNITPTYTSTATPSPSTALQTTSPTYSPSPITTPSPVTTATPTPTLTVDPTISPSPVATPAITPTPVPTPTTSKIILGFTTYYYSGDTSSYNSMSAKIGSLDEIATATHVTDGYGNITGLVPTNQLNLAKANNITPLLMLGNNFDGAVAKSLLENATNRQNCINNLLSILKVNGYKGVNIDIEGVYSSDRTYYTQFMKEVYATLKPLGYIVTASVPAKTVDNSAYTWNYAYDYASIGNYVDQLLLMTYDEHYPGGAAGPVASINWVTNVVNYSKSVVPKEKLLLGLAAYGYDWSTNGTKAYSVNGCINLATSYGATIFWDDTAKSPYFNYTDSSSVKHTVWFENATSISYKLNLTNSTDIGGIGVWRLGLENTDYWNMIKSKLGR